jgi:alpha-tubulin suppressor-like RCC1 family protein
MMRATCRTILAAAAVLAAGACSDSPTPPSQQPTQRGPLVLSKPVVSSGVSPTAAQSPAVRAGGGNPVVFTSLAPGTAPEGAASVVNVTTGLVVEATLRGGGLDPVPVPASVGDSIAVTVPGATGERTLGAVVTASEPPAVVRTIPATNATFVPRNRPLVVVFSEPVAPATVGTSSVRLLRGGTAVEGTVAFLDSSHVTVVFTPAAQLDADTRYQLVVSGSVANLSGDRLEADVTVDFTTGQTVVGPVAAVAVYPMNITVPSGRMMQFTALLTDAAGDTLVGQSVRWTSGDDSIATLSDVGINMGIMVRGANPGTVTITATSGAVPGTAMVTVAGTLSPVTYTALSVGYDHTCGVTTTGGVYCWGGNADGELGSGGMTSTPYPSAVVGGLNAASVGTGLWRSCALTGAGASWCWGDSGLTNIITLGTGATVPVQVPGAPVLATMAVGGTHACGLTSAGQAYCWGVNSAGQLGDGTNSGSSVPRAVAGGLRFTALSAGVAHTCGLAADSTAWCWGYNTLGALGNGSTLASAVPVAVQGGLHFVTLAGGYGHTCGVTAAGAVYCWGANGRGQLGATSAQTCPGQADAVATDACSLTPLAVAQLPTAHVVGAGYTHTCALTVAGAAYCWGENTYAQLGNGTSADSPRPVAVAGGLVLAGLSSGYYHSCGITTGGIAWCWGQGVHGELGDGTTQTRTTPVRVAGQQ